MPAPPVGPIKDGRRYALLFALQTVGAVVILGYALPLYRAVVADPAAHRASSGPVIWASSAAVLIQVGFWICHHLQPPLPEFRNALIGYVILFLSRMSFLVGTAIFGFVFITQSPEFHIPASRYFLTIAGLFSFFLYAQEVERLANRLLGRGEQPGRSNAQ